MNKLTFAFLIAAFLLLIAPVQATIYVGGNEGVTTISGAIEKASENETIIVYEGIYRENVVIDKPLIIKTVGNATVEAADNTKPVVWLKANSAVFSDFTVKGGYVGIHLDNVRNCRIENSTAFGNDFGIALLSSSSNSIVNNSASENGDRGLQIQNSEENDVWNNIFSKNFDGIGLHSSNRNALWNNSACENGDDGIYFANSSENEVSNNIVNKNLKSIVLIRSNNNKITNNTACENGEVGFHLEYSSWNEVSNNIANKNLYGIVLLRSSNSKIENNTAENGDWGTLLVNSSENEVSNNIFNKNLDMGIALYRSSSNKIKNNTACENRRAGIYLLNSSENKIKNNTACENGDYGIHFVNSSENEVRNNIANKNDNGILLFSSSNKIKNNTACENRDNGIYLLDSSENKIKNNTACENGDTGIYLLNSSENKIKNNAVCENGDYGIYFANSSENKACNNIFNKNLYGIVILSSDTNEITNNTACENRARGINLEYSWGNKMNSNIINKNLNGIILLNSKNSEIRNNTICENGDTGLYIEYSDENEVWNNIFSKNLDGIFLTHSNRNALRNNSASENGDTGLQIQDSDENEVWNNIFSRNSYGISLSSSNRNALRNNSASENGDTGLQIQDSDENEVWNNIFSKNLDGIFLSNSNRNALKNNSACKNGDKGLYIEESEENEVWNNIFSRNSYGISLSNSNRNALKNNSASENGNNGLSIGDSEDNEVWNNIFTRNLYGIVLHRSNRNALWNNSASENGDTGLQIQESEENEVWNNIFSKNLAGIFLHGSDRNVLRNNSASENGNRGLEIQDSEENEVWNNIFSKNLLYGIVLHSSNRNVLWDNSASENGNNGLSIGDSEDNEVWNNIFSRNLYGIVLTHSNRNALWNNSASENGDTGLQIQDSEENEVWNNIFSKNLAGIVLISSNRNALTTNNIVDSKNYQARIQKNSTLNTFDCNYWSDYAGEDKNRDGIGDEPYEIDRDNKDEKPYMNYSGWLNVVIRPEYWEFYTKKGDVNYFYNNFSVENRLNRATNVAVILEQNLEFVTDSDSSENNKTFCIEPKSTENITLRLNVTNMEGYILRTITFETGDYTKPTLVYGLVQPKINDVKIEGVDFHRNVVKGQINPFEVILRNYGDRDEFDVKLKMGSEFQKSVYLNETETRTVQFEIDTSDMPLGINKGQVVVSKGKRLDYLNLTMFVASEFEASSLIVTNLKRMTDKWGNDSVSASKLKEKLIELSFHPTVNGIIVGVENETNCSNLYDEWDNDKGPEKANEIAKAIKKLIDTKFKEYPNIEYLVVVGDDRIIPYYRILDNTSEPFIAGWDTERNYHDLNVNSTVGSALHRNMFLTDNIYAANRPIEWETAAVCIPELYIPIMPVGRLVESPEDISAVIDAFFQQEYVNPDKIFVSGSDFMKDSASLCGSTLEKKTKGDVTIVVNETVDSFQQIKDEFLNISNNIVFVFQHAEHDRFLIHYGNITSQDVSQSLVDLNNTIICSLGCHSGLNVPPNASIDDLDLVQAFAQKGVLAYIAPTGYSIGLRRTIGAHELLISYLTKHLCEGRDVGTALMQAKQEYWATNYDFNYIDEKVFESTTLYGLPMVRINIPRSKVKIKSMEVGIHKEQPDTLVIRPLHTQNSTPDGNYYMTQSRELLSDPGKPVQPKEIRIFYPTSARVLRGAVMNSSKYHQNKSFTPLIDAYMQSHEIPEFKSYRIENWYPAQIFKINSISYPKDPTQSRQYLIIITGQYKGRTLPGMPGEERLYKELSFDLYYARADDETKPPVIMDVSPTRINDTINITVNVMDKSGIQRVLVTYTDINGDWGEWRSKACKLEEGDLWCCNISAKEEIEFFVQAVDNAGNAAVVEQLRI